MLNGTNERSFKLKKYLMGKLRETEKLVEEADSNSVHKMGAGR